MSILSRRAALVRLAALPSLGALASLGVVSGCAQIAGEGPARPRAASQGSAHPNLAAAAQPIPTAEFSARIAKAQNLMLAEGMQTLLIEAGSALTYFTGVRWSRSERFTGVVIPANAAPVIITPFFEEPSIRDMKRIDAEIRTWHEDEDPFARVGDVLREAKAASGRLGVEETVRQFIVEGAARAAPGVSVVSGNPVTRACRMIKSPAELALMQTANNITLAAYRHIYPRIRAGMTSFDIAAMMSASTRAMGGDVMFSMVLLNEASAYPHGTASPQTVREGSTILMDCGCAVHGYQSDISRTFVFGEPTPKQRQVWSTVKRGQELGLETARVGVAAGKVDEAVRRYYESLGYGPGYLTPGLSHRLGHGIGMDGHEPVNLVRNETTLLAPGMCFSNEPGLYEFGAFGVRLEDCFFMTDAGPKLFTPLSRSIDDPFG